MTKILFRRLCATHRGTDCKESARTGGYLLERRLFGRPSKRHAPERRSGMRSETGLAVS